MAFTTSQWAILALVLVAGWLLGLMSRSGGAKWKRELAEERSRNAELKRDYDARIKELERTRPVATPVAEDRPRGRFAL